MLQESPLTQWNAYHKATLLKMLRELDRPSLTPAELQRHEQQKNAQWASKFERHILEAAGHLAQTISINFTDFGNFGADDLGDFIRKYYQILVDEIDLVGQEFFDSTIKDFEGELPPTGKVKVVVQGAPLVHSVRTLRCELLGELNVVRATVTRTTDVRPELRVAAFECAGCGSIVPAVTQKFKFTDPTICPKKGCGNRSKWILRQDGCEFGDWQKLRVQENAEEIPAGSMPRTIDVVLREGACEQCKPGDKVLVTGCLIAVPDVPSLMKPGDVPKAVSRGRSARERSDFGLQDNAVTGLRALGVRDLSYRLCFLGYHVKVTNNTGDAYREDPSPSLESKFQQIAKSTKCLDLLSGSFAPEIFGHETLKKGLLLMLAGGVEKWTAKDGIKLRGDINVCILGDPGTAKSQLLKFVQRFACRAVFTSGKTSTGAGLTVTVQKDPEQMGESVIEAGALMLADKGVCCIDEFDKMDEKDMVAIHEAMEQQTISIAKAGIQATLNARACVLAACNPAGGRYDAAKSFRQNVNLSAPILSRFDLFFVMLDDTENDDLVARHITKMHAEPHEFTSKLAAAAKTALKREELQQYILTAKSVTPTLTEAARELIVKSYAALRHRELQPGAQRNVRTTVRQLEALIRLSEAVAKLHLEDTVRGPHVLEAYKIFCDSLTRVKRDQIDLGDDDDEEDDDDDFVVDADEFERIASIIISRLKSLEDSGGGSFVETGELATWVLGQLDDDDGDVERRCKWIGRIIRRMAVRDLSLIEEVRESAAGVVAVVRLHPNYTGMHTAGRHANLSTAFFIGEGERAPAPAAGPLDDKNFEDLLAESMAADELFGVVG